MAVRASYIETLVRQRLNEPVPRFWSSEELLDIITSGVKDLWRDIVDLKQEHFLTVDTSSVTMQASTSSLTGVPSDVHKVYLIEPVDTSSNSTSKGLIFKPKDYNHIDFQMARSLAAVDASNNTIYYAITGPGAPTNTSPVIYVAPQITSAVTLRFCYIPTVARLTDDSYIPIPGEVDNALVAWTVAYAKAKENETGVPDPGWMTIYGAEKSHILQALGLRQYHEPSHVDAVFERYW